MKLFKIGFFYVVLIPLMSLFLLKFTPTDVGPGWPSYLLKLDRSVATFAQDTGQRTVIVGPSYARRIEIPGCHNLGLPSACPSEIIGIIKTYCKPQDRIIFLFTIREFTLSKSPRLAVTHDTLRRMELVQAAAHKCLITPVENKSNKYELQGEDLRTLKKAADFNHSPSLSPKYLYREIYQYSAALPSEETIEIFQSLHEEFPNMVFVMHPTYPLKSVSGNSVVAEQINRMIESRISIRRLMANSGLPFIDLSDFLPTECLQNYSHLTRKGSQLLADEIVRRLTLVTETSR